MAKRSGHAESGCHDGIRERPATGMGSPERRLNRRLKNLCHWEPQVENLRPLGDGHGQPRAAAEPQVEKPVPLGTAG
jgi:hypothetical protein